jgi:hypothetical protein
MNTVDKTNSDSNAFPVDLDTSLNLEEGYWYATLGLTKREHFAIESMKGILSNSNYSAPRANKLEGMAIDAVSAADALIIQLGKGGVS